MRAAPPPPRSAVSSRTRAATTTRPARARRRRPRADGPLAVARIDGTRGMLEHARGRAAESLAAFTSAAEQATRAGAVIEEATYLTGLAAAAVDCGAVGDALASALRAALLWERLGRPALAARALLGRAIR